MDVLRTSFGRLVHTEICLHSNKNKIKTTTHGTTGLLFLSYPYEVRHLKLLTLFRYNTHLKKGFAIDHDIAMTSTQRQLFLYTLRSEIKNKNKTKTKQKKHYFVTTLNYANKQECIIKNEK